MEKEAMSEQQWNELARRLQISAEHYSAMKHLLEQISAVISDEEASVNPLLERLKGQQRQIIEVDAALNKDLEVYARSHPGTLEAHPLFEKRVRIMDEVKQMNDLLLPRISGIMSLISHEIGELKGGRNAISGYRVQGKGSTSKRHYTA